MEQYYTGVMDLGLINGVDEGVFIYVAMCWTVAYYGPEEILWNNKTNIMGYNLNRSDLLMRFLQTVVLISLIPAFVHIWQLRNSEHSKRIISFWHGITHVLFFPVSVATFHVASMYSPT